MADKKERILITKCSGWCHALRVSCDPFDDDDGMYCDKSGKWVRVTEKDCEKCKAPVLLGLSRSEVIEKMAKAIYESMCPNFSQMFVGWRAYTKIAEAALNSLLEDKK